MGCSEGRFTTSQWGEMRLMHIGLEFSLSKVCQKCSLLNEEKWGLEISLSKVHFGQQQVLICTFFFAKCYFLNNFWNQVKGYAGEVIFGSMNDQDHFHTLNYKKISKKTKCSQSCSAMKYERFLLSPWF